MEVRGSVIVVHIHIMLTGGFQSSVFGRHPCGCQNRWKIGATALCWQWRDAYYCKFEPMKHHFEQFIDASNAHDTQIEDLFYNTPTRLSALRSSSEEYSRILDVVTKYAVHNPKVSFLCKKVHICDIKHSIYHLTLQRQDLLLQTYQHHPLLILPPPSDYCTGIQSPKN